MAKKYRKFGPFALIFFSLIGCHNPRTKRTTYSNQNYYQNHENPENQQYWGGIASQSETTITIPREASHCTWFGNESGSYVLRSRHFSQNEGNSEENNLNLCQHSGNELVIYIQLKNSITSQVCLFPMSHSGNKQTYLGNPQCRDITVSHRIYDIPLVKDRPNFADLPITGVMVMKKKDYFYASPFNRYESSPFAYVQCSRKILDEEDARYCQTFKDSGHYYYHQFGN